MHRARYVLDNFATVAEAVEGLKKVNAIRDAVCKDVPITDGQGHVLGAHIVSANSICRCQNTFI